MAGVPLGLVVLVPNHKVGLDLRALLARGVKQLDEAGVFYCEFVVDDKVDLALRSQVLVLVEVLVVPALVALCRVGCAVHEN